MKFSVSQFCVFCLSKKNLTFTCEIKPLWHFLVKCHNKLHGQFQCLITILKLYQVSEIWHFMVQDIRNFATLLYRLKTIKSYHLTTTRLYDSTFNLWEIKLFSKHSFLINILNFFLHDVKVYGQFSYHHASCLLNFLWCKF